mmetsp:Transcript_22663/g.36472  ORF Transcript_22663/g.36472 Transcript_22663/m.36472 type:complete len:437 (-) Transcript_22663:2158-3468(-)
MSSALRAPVLLRARALASSRFRVQQVVSATRVPGVTWHRGAGHLRRCPAPRVSWGGRPNPAAHLQSHRQYSASFRLFAGGLDGPAGPTSDDEGPGSGHQTRDWVGELTFLPPLDPTKEEEEIDMEAEPTTMVLPVFPLGSTAYMPFSDHILNIFEPRYRQMYSDILFNGSRRFAVPVSHPETGRLASVAPVFYLEDLKEVSEQTQDAVKYVCSHKVIGRVRIKRTLNDRVWADRTSYLKAVVEPLEDGDDDEDLSTREGQLSERFIGIIRNQTKLQEPVRFTENLIDTLSAARGEDGLWRLAGLWQSLLQNRLSAKENELSNEIQGLLRSYLANQGQDMQSKVTVQFDSLPADIRSEFTRLQQTYREESVAMVNATLYPFVVLVQCETHGERLGVFGEMLEEEEKRLQAKVALQSLFSGKGSDQASEGKDDPPLTA